MSASQGDTVDSPLVIQLVGDATAVNSTTITVASSLNPIGIRTECDLYGDSDDGRDLRQSDRYRHVLRRRHRAGVGRFLGRPRHHGDGHICHPRAGGWKAHDHGFVQRRRRPLGEQLDGSERHRAALTQMVLEGTATSLVSSVNPSAAGQNVTFTATVTAPGGGGVTPDGTHYLLRRHHDSG